MVLPFESLKARLQRLDETRRVACVEEVRLRYNRWRSGELPLTTLCAEAGDALDRYSIETLDAWLTGVASSRGPEPQRWLADEYPESVGRTATAIRDVIAEPAARHAVAQILQTGVLQAHSQLHHVLDSKLTVNRSY